MRSLSRWNCVGCCCKVQQLRVQLHSLGAIKVTSEPLGVVGRLTPSSAETAVSATSSLVEASTFPIANTMDGCVAETGENGVAVEDPTSVGLSSLDALVVLKVEKQNKVTGKVIDICVKRG
ncbi:hypothetical protein V6N13_067848 [Hibiscus sabdariffa]|uniref:Uncharacterized protein n=1 Tax=Hibiscus sabdariffa TaxID=183260 RepID=A0ABR2DV37_9ROSI